MPSFYPRTMPRQLPLTPPEFVPSYMSNGCGGSQYQQQGYNVPGMVLPSESGYDTPDNYAHSGGLAPSMAYQPMSGFGNPAVMQTQSRYYEAMVPNVLPPMRAQHQMTMDDADLQHRQRQQRAQAERQPKEEKAVGGVSATLDYELNHMVDFVSEMAQGMYALYKSRICMADIDIIRSIQPGTTPQSSFHKWVSQVLQATRLPSSTILLSLHYLSVRMTMLSSAGVYKVADGQIYRLLTIALVLGSKFLDDNTFINKSWSEVSGIKVAELNQLEREWLVAINFDLHCELKGKGFENWLSTWKDYESRCVSRDLVREKAKLTPLETNIQRQKSLHKSFSPTGYQQRYPQSAAPTFASKQPQYNHSNYGAYDPWARQSMDNSPMSAPHTSPTTPEYYSNVGHWNQEGYNRRSMFGFPTVVATQAPAFGHQTYTPQYTPQYSRPSWNGHGPGCNCMYCTPQHMPYLMAPGFAPQPVAG